MDRPLSRTTNRKGEKTQITKIRNEREDNITNLTEEKAGRECHELSMPTN